jgi:FtsZ-interacting cell division protein ZipA
MSDNAAMLVVIIVVLLVLAVVGLLLWRTRSRERHAREAAELRTRADAQTDEIDHAQRTAASQRAAAEAAREQAEHAEARAAEAERELAQTEALYEDTVREADLLDPSINDRDEHYLPGRPNSPRHSI